MKGDRWTVTITTPSGLEIEAFTCTEEESETTVTTISALAAGLRETAASIEALTRPKVG